MLLLIKNAVTLFVYLNVNNQDTILTSNFMGYNEDACINTFTDEQYIHMNENIFDYRNHYIQDYF